MGYGNEFEAYLTEALRARKGARVKIVNHAYSRGYAAASVDRLTNDWKTSSLSADGELKFTLKNLRGRSRDLAMNNDYARKFLTMCVMNIAYNMNFQSKIKDSNGSFDTAANKLIEGAFKKWSKRGNCTVCGQHSLSSVFRLDVESTVRDGEILIRKVKGFDNPWGFALQIIEADHLDENLNKALLPNGNVIRMGVEFDEWRRPVAYYILTQHPGDYAYTSAIGQRHARIPADEIIHSFAPHRAGQSRGVPWMHTSMTRLNMVGAYEEAELVASRGAASKMGFLIPGDNATGYEGDDKDTDGNPISEFEPGIIEKLPKNWDFKPWDPSHPAGNFEPFMKVMLRGIASGLNVAYNSLASDLEKVNYSSIRSGVLEERNNWRVLQKWLIETVCMPIFEGWLEMALITGAVPLPFTKYDKFNDAKFQPRGWDWVDPAKDETANEKGLKNLTKTRTQILGEQGLDIEDVFEQLKHEKELAEKYNLIAEEVKTDASKNNGAN